MYNEPIDTDGDLMTIQEYLSGVQYDCFTDYDGS